MMTHLQCVLRESRRTAVGGGTAVQKTSRKVRGAGTRMRRGVSGVFMLILTAATAAREFHQGPERR